MEKRVAGLLILLLILPFLSAVEFDMNSEFKQGETLMAKVSGVFPDSILKENVIFYRGHVKIPLEFDITKIDEEFYIYAQLLGKESGNYSLSIEETRHKQGAEIIDDSIIKNFSITNKTADFSINPGFIDAKGKFFIEVYNQKDSKLELDITFKTKTDYVSNKSFFASLFGDSDEIQEDSSTTITLKSGQTKKINFDTINIEKPTFRTIYLSSVNSKYEIPVYILVNQSEMEEKQKDMKFDQGLNVSMSTDSEIFRTLYLENTGKVSIKNISLILSDSLRPYINLSIDSIDELDESSMVRIDLTFISSNEENTLEGQLKARAPNEVSDIYAYSPISLNFIKDYIPIEEEIVTSSKTCLELNGKICGDNEECQGEARNAKDGVCCLVTCKEIEQSSTGKIIGWLIIIIIVGFLIWFFKKKYSGATNKADLFKFLKKKE